MNIGGDENYNSYPNNFKSNTLEKDISLYYSFKDNYELKVVENELFSNSLYVQINTLGEDENIKFGNKYYTFLGMFLTDEYDRIDKIDLNNEKSHIFALIIHCKNIQTNSNIFITIPIKNSETNDSTVHNLFYNTTNMTFDVNEFIPNKKFYNYSSNYKDEVSNFIIFDTSELTINLDNVKLNKKRNILRNSIKTPLSLSKYTPFRKQHISSTINNDIITIECNPYEESDELKYMNVKNINNTNMNSNNKSNFIYDFIFYILLLSFLLMTLYAFKKMINVFLENVNTRIHIP